jgi:hypothetical protein
MIFILSGAFLTHVFSGDPFHVRVRPVVPLLFGTCFWSLCVFADHLTDIFLSQPHFSF